MKKINREEYQVLKNLDDQWKWIARDEKETHESFYSNQVMAYRTRPNKYNGLCIWSDGSGGERLPEELFQFIQWEDREPCSIAELIEEYENEETEAKSKQELIEKWESAIESAEFYGKGKEEELIGYMKDFVGDLKQLDEPEVTLDRAFEKVAESYPMTKEEVWRHLERLVAHGGKVTYGELDDPEVLSQEWIDEHKMYCLHSMQSGYFISEKLLQNLLVPKQDELESKIKVLIEFYKQEDGAYSNPENAWIGGFIEDLESLVEEEEQKFYVLNSEGETMIRKNDSGIRTSSGFKIRNGFEGENYKFTEQEIKDYDDRFWPFAVKVEELE